MTHIRRAARPVLFLTLALSLTLACSALSGKSFSIPGIPSFSGTATADAAQNAGTPGSPMAGDWAAPFTSGQVVFHIAHDGSRVMFVDLKLNGWKCGGTIMSTGMQVGSDWSIEDGQFEVQIDLNPPHVEELTFDGSFDKATQTWSGTWDGDEYGTHCSGTWDGAKQ